MQKEKRNVHQRGKGTETTFPSKEKPLFSCSWQSIHPQKHAALKWPSAKHFGIEEDVAVQIDFSYD